MIKAPSRIAVTESPGTPRDSQYEHFAGAKVHGHISHQRREEGHDQSTDDAAAEGSEHCNGQSLAGLSLLAHGVTVQQGGGSSRGAGGMDQDGKDRAAVHTAAVDAQQQADGRDQIHTKRERNEQRHTHGGGHARDRAQQNAAVQAVPLPKKADFYASAAQAQQFPYLSAACFSVLLFPLLRYRGFLQQFAFFHANAPKLHIQNTQFWRRSFKKIRAAPAAISSETVPQLYFPPKRAEWYCHKAAQPFCIVLTSLFLLITIL